MSSRPPTINWAEELQYDWTSQQGLGKLKNLVADILPFELDEFQLLDSAFVLNGVDVFVISATGSGKSALIYVPAMARKEMITVVIEPTNFLQDNMVASLAEKGVTGVVINAETLKKASQEGRNLWHEAQEGIYQVIATSPEKTRCPEFRTMIYHKIFRPPWGSLVVDEAHLVDEWGDDFREIFKDLWSLRSQGPEHLTVVALSGSVEPGGQTDRILAHLGFREGNYRLDKRNCERDNVDIIFRQCQYPFSGYVFRDLDWLVPIDMQSVSHIPKHMLFVETIELGHRVTLYLRSLLPVHLRKSSRHIIRHVHSILCSDCKTEALAALLDPSDTHPTAIFVTTAILNVGVDPPDVAEVIVYPSPGSASSIRQQLGRVARRQGTRGRATFYFKKTDSEAADEYAQQQPLDPRMLTIKANPDTASEGETLTVEEPVVMGSGGDDDMDVDSELGIGGKAKDADGDLDEERMDVETAETESRISDGVDEGDDGEDVEEGEGEGQESEQAGTKTAKHTSGKTTREKVSKPSASLSKSRLLVMGATSRGVCITRQIGMVSCKGDDIPEPRPVELSLDDEGSDEEEDGSYRWERLLVKEQDDVAQQLRTEAIRIRTMPPFHPDALFITSTGFLTNIDIARITKNFHLLETKEDLRLRLQEWSYWDISGESLWAAVEGIMKTTRAMVVKRHEVSLEKGRQKREQKKGEMEEVRRHLAAEGLGSVKRVRLIFGPKDTESSQLRTSAGTVLPPRSRSSSLPLPLSPSHNVSPSRKRAANLEVPEGSPMKRRSISTRSQNAKENTVASSSKGRSRRS